MNIEIEKIEDLGWNDFFEENRVKLGLSDFCVARVMSENRGLYKVKTIDDNYLAKITGKKVFESSNREDYPAVGDWVALEKIDNNDAIIHEILPRKTILKRKYSGKDETQIIATNIDVAFIVESIDRDYSLNRLERYCAMARDSGIKPVAIINKIDLISNQERDGKTEEIKSRLTNVDIIYTSAMSDGGLQELQDYIVDGKTYCFLGSSGVGKSSLINKLLGTDDIKVGGIGTHSNRGKHTTTQRDMYFLNDGGIVIDNPGIREVGVTDVKTGIDEQFNTITASAKKCKFVNCTHTHEPGCGVLADVKKGTLKEDEYKNYIGLKKESEHYGMTKREQKEKSKKFGKFMKTTKSELRKYGHKDYE